MSPELTVNLVIYPSGDISGVVQKGDGGPVTEAQTEVLESLMITISMMGELATRSLTGDDAADPEKIAQAEAEAQREAQNRAHAGDN